MSICQTETTYSLFRCVVCGLEMSGGTWINGAGPYCPRCVPKSEPQPQVNVTVNAPPQEILWTIWGGIPISDAGRQLDTVTGEIVGRRTMADGSVCVVVKLPPLDEEPRC